MGQKVEVVVEEVDVEEEGSRFVEATRKVLLAGIGAVVLTQEQIESFVNKLVERGEIAEKDGRKLVRDVMEKRKKEAKKAEDELDKRMVEVLDRMNVPTKNDIEALSAKITALTKKVDELKKES
ncbi:MAG TPA: phasin family protein [Anaerolineae bacterium]|jgi:polyhydroxyalkanoate synthesis regulator phasin|nr:phasin family protein [Anaerolineae bacterium]